MAVFSSHIRTRKALIPGLLFLACSIGVGSHATAALLLRCEFDAGGQRQTLDFGPESDPYRIKAVPINNHFRFKAVVIGNAHTIDYIKLYSYYVTSRKPVLLHEAKYLHPELTPGEVGHSLTGVNYLYSPILERQFQYECTLRESGA